MPPLAAAAALAVGLGVLKRVVASRTGAPVPERANEVQVPVPGSPAAALNGTGHEALKLFADDLASGTVPGVRRIREQMHLGSGKATPGTGLPCRPGGGRR